MSSVNFFIQSRQEFVGFKLSELLNVHTGISCKNSPVLSNRVCNMCALKIKRTCIGLSFIRETLNTPHPNFDESNKENKGTGSDNQPINNTAIEIRTKRALPMTVSMPERSPRPKKLSRKESQGNCKKSLQFNNQSRVSVIMTDVTCTDNDMRLLKKDDICVSDKKAKVKVMIQWPNGNTEIQMPSAEEWESTSLKRNLSLKKWDAVSNDVWTHPILQLKMLKSLWRVMNRECKTYCSLSDCVFKGKSTKELISFSNKAAYDEICLKCPTWIHCIKGACRIKCEMDDPEDLGYFSVNSIVLATSVAACVQNKSMSALTYRISSILFHSGARHQDIIRLNRLGVCMSPDMILGLQRSLGKNYDAKVLQWNDSLEQHPAETNMILQEMVEKQLQTRDDSMTMDVDIAVDISEETLKNYRHYKPHVFRKVSALLEAKRKEMLPKSNAANILQETVRENSSISKFPLFK